MDKNREVRRGGVLGKRHVSATRRSRASTGFKYSSVISNNEDGDEMVEKSPSPNPRLQENNKERTSKKHSGRMSPSLQEVSDCWRDPERERSQSKRKRMEVQNHLSASAKEMDDNSDDNTEIGRSEDDDDLPPPTVPRRPWKLKLHGKPREDLSPIDPASVPRRLRTAMTKRQQESSSHSHVTDIPKQRHSNDVGAAAMSTPTSSNLVVNPGRKKKPDNHKPPTAKLAKISSSKVSKTEVEVAETLYDLARMFTAQTMPSPPETNAEPTIAAKSGLATPATGRDMKQSPVASNADVASPSSSLAQSQSGVLKKKRPRMSLKTKEEGLTSDTGTCIPAEITSIEQALCLHSENGQSPTEPRASPKVGALAAPVIGSTITLPDIKVEVENVETLEAKSSRMEAISPSMEIKISSDPPEKLSMSISGGPVDVVNKDIKLEENLVTLEAIQKPEVENRSLESAPKEDCSVNKFEIDLMVPPEGIDKADETLDSNIPNAQEKEQTLPDNKGNGNLDSNMTTAKVKEEMNLATISSAEIITSVDKDRKKEDDSKNLEFDKQSIESLEPDEINDWKPEKDNGIARERNKVDASKDRSKQDMVKQTQRGTGNNAKLDSGPKCDPNSSANTTTTSDFKSTQLPVSMAGWAAGFPTIGYYTWPTPLPMTGMPSHENSRVPPQLPSFFFPPRQARKTCATHVDITHFIERHQRIKSNPLWAVAAYGNPTALYGNGKMGPPVSSALEPGIRPPDLSMACLKVKEPTGAGPASANVHGAKERANSSCVDTLELKSSLQKQIQAGHKNPTLVLGHNDPVLGMPIDTTVSATVSGSSTGTPNRTGSNILVTAAMFSGGSSVPTSSPPVSSTGNGLLDGSVANAAVLHAPLFPFSISTGPFVGAAYGGHLVPQQVPQIFSNPFYDTHMVSQQLGNTTSGAPQKQPKNSQGSFPSGSSQSQQQETLMSSQAMLSTTGVSLLQPKQANEKNATTDGRSTKKQLPIVQRNMYSQNIPAVHVTNIDSTSPLSMPSQDFSPMTNFGGKQTGKMKQQAQAQVIPQQQLTSQAQKQQKAYIQSQTQYHVPDLKEFDSKVSHSSLNRGPMHADLVGLSGVASIMTPQGELLHSMVDLRGHGQSQKSIHNQTTSGQSHQYNMPVGHDQKMHQRQHALMERKVINDAAESVRTINESLYAKVGHAEWDPSRNVQGFQTNTDSKRANTVNSTVITFSEGMPGQAVTVGKFPTGQGIHFPGQNANVASQGIRRSHSIQDSGYMKTTNIASAGSLLTSPSGTPSQAMQGAVTKSQGQQLRSEQPTMNSRISPASSIISSVSASSTLPTLQSVSKAGAGALTKNSTSLKDSHSSLQKPPMASTTVKGISAANMASVMGPGQTSTAVQTQISQNRYSVQQQQFQQLRHPQTVQFMDSAQKNHGQPVLQNYPLIQNYSQQTNKHPSSQHLQFGQHILIHQPLQYEVGTQSQVHSQPISQQLTLHHQQQFQQPPRQTASLTQQHKNIQPVLTAPFSISTSGNLAHNIVTVDTGNARSIGLDGATTANSTAETNVPCSSSKTSCNEGSALPHGHNGAVSSVQHVSNSNTISVSYSNSLSQPMPNSAAVDKLGEKTNQ